MTKRLTYNYIAVGFSCSFPQLKTSRDTLLISGTPTYLTADQWTGEIPSQSIDKVAEQETQETKSLSRVGAGLAVRGWFVSRSNHVFILSINSRRRQFKLSTWFRSKLITADGGGVGSRL